MNLLEWQSSFYSLIGCDNRINATHISLYMALLHEIACAGSAEFVLRPSVIMDKAKISSKVTYHRSMRALYEYGYIFYAPSFRPGESKVKLIELDS